MDFLHNHYYYLSLKNLLEKKENHKISSYKPSNTMSTIFDAYDQEFNNLSREIQKNSSELKATSNDKDRSSSLIRQIEALLSQASDLIKQMNVEVRSHDLATRKILSEKVSHYSKSLTSLKADFERIKEVAQRSSLIGEKSSGDRQRLLDTNDK